MLVRYRRGLFMFNSICACDPEVNFYRSHEACLRLGQPRILTRVEQRQKRRMQLGLSFDHEFTDIDYLLNSGPVKRAVVVLSNIQKRLRLR